MKVSDLMEPSCSPRGCEHCSSISGSRRRPREAGRQAARQASRRQVCFSIVAGSRTIPRTVRLISQIGHPWTSGVTALLLFFCQLKGKRSKGPA